MKTAFALAALFTLTACDAAAAGGDQDCGTTKAILGAYERDFGEKVAFKGRSTEGQMTTTIIITNPKTGTWTEFQSVEGVYDTLCVIDVGREATMN